MKTFFLRDFQADTIESLDLKCPDRLQLKPVKKSKDLQTDGTNADENCDHLQAVAEMDVLFDTRLKGLPNSTSYRAIVIDEKTKNKVCYVYLITN